MKWLFNVENTNFKKIKTSSFKFQSSVEHIVNGNV